jgi:hypothetical protein
MPIFVPCNTLLILLTIIMEVITNDAIKAAM